MPRTNKLRLVTRQKSKLQYGPCEFAKTEPSTYRQLLQYYCYIKNSQP